VVVIAGPPNLIQKGLTQPQAEPAPYFVKN
jgi:hypothetical protein